LKFFFVLFAQSMSLLVHGLIQRSRSLAITPIAFAVLGVVTMVYSALKGLSSVILVGCTGIVLLLLGIAAIILCERITGLGIQPSDRKP
jgi:exosortase/archaeosortase